MSAASFSFSFSLPSGRPTESPLKAALKPSRESSPSPLRGTAGTGSSGSGPPAGLGAGAGLAHATEGAVFLAVSLVSMLYFQPFSGVSLDVLVVLHRVAGTQRLKISATRKLKRAFTVDCFDGIVLFVPLLASGASCCNSGFPNEYVLMKATRNTSTHSAGKGPQDQVHNMKGCSRRR